MFRIIRAFQNAFDTLKKFNPRHEQTWRENMYENRWRNFFLTLIFNGIVGSFILAGVFFKEGFHTPIHWAIGMILASLLLLIGCITLVGYILLIVLGR